jgi:hypothetical protein
MTLEFTRTDNSANERIFFYQTSAKIKLHLLLQYICFKQMILEKNNIKSISLTMQIFFIYLREFSYQLVAWFIGL